MLSRIARPGRVVLIGALIALVLGTGGLVLSSLTDRRIVAVAIIVVLFLVLTVTANVGYELVGFEEDWGRYLLLISPNDAFFALIDQLFPGTTNEGDGSLLEAADFSTGFLVTYMVAFVVLGIVFIRWRYSPRE